MKFESILFWFASVSRGTDLRNMTIHALAVCAAGAGCAVFFGVLHGSRMKSIRSRSSDLRKMQPLTHEEHEKILRQGFTPEKVPVKLDCIVIGSGIGL